METFTDPATVLQELFEETIPADPREPALRRHRRAAIARTQARLALDRLNRMGFAIVETDRGFLEVEEPA
jgi:hypothetical protein